MKKLFLRFLAWHWLLDDKARGELYGAIGMGVAGVIMLLPIAIIAGGFTTFMSILGICATPVVVYFHCKWNIGSI